MEEITRAGSEKMNIKWMNFSLIIFITGMFGFVLGSQWGTWTETGTLKPVTMFAGAWMAIGIVTLIFNVFNWWDMKNW